MTMTPLLVASAQLIPYPGWNCILHSESALRCAVLRPTSHRAAGSRHRDSSFFCFVPKLLSLTFIDACASHARRSSSEGEYRTTHFSNTVPGEYVQKLRMHLIRPARTMLHY